MKAIPPEDEFYFQWHITEKCNLRCTHCYHDSYASSGELSLEQLTEVFRKTEEAISSWGLTASFSLTGGEPFLRSEDLYSVMSLMDKSDSVGYYDILTNGSLISKKDVVRLKDAVKLRRIQLSLESHQKNENDQIRGEGSFEKTLACISLLKSAGLEVAVMTTISRRNMNSINELINLLTELNVDTFAIERFIPEGQGDQMRDLMLSTNETKTLYKVIHGIGTKIKRPRVLMYRPLFALIDHKDPTVGAMCSVGNNALTIMHDGSVYPCRRLPISLGNIFNDGLYKIWYDSDLLWTMRNKDNIKGCGDCQMAPVCRGCRAMALFATGDYLAKDPQCWKDELCFA